MAYDGLITKFLGQGLAADRPVTPNLHPSAVGWYFATDTGTISLWANSVWADYYSADDVNAALASVTGTSGAGLDGVATGCGISYSGSGLTFNMSAGSFYINNTLYTAAAQSITLSAADATNPRIDVLAVDNTGTLVKITGTPAASPSQPSIDSSTQLYLTFVSVPATATSISGITDESIYLENTEWTTSTSGSGFNANSTNNPYAGSKDIEGTTVTAASYVKLVRSSPMSFDGAGNLTLHIRSKAAWASTRWLSLRFYLAGVAKGLAVNLKSGSFGFDSAVTSGYQPVTIDKSLFAVPAGTNVDELRIVDVGGSIGFYLDNIILQNTGTSTGTGGTSGLTQTQADARYALISSLTSLSTAVSSSLSTTNSTNVTQSTSLSQISNSLSTANSTNVTQSTSLSQISSSLSGAISSTSSLSTAVSTVISGSISAANSRIDSLSTAGGSSTRWDFVPPAASHFTLASGDGTNLTLSDDTDVGLVINNGATVATSIVRYAYVTPPNGDWTVVARMWGDFSKGAGLYAGPVAVESGTGKYYMVGLAAASQGTRLAVGTVAGTFSSNSDTGICINGIWYRMKRNGSNMTVEISGDGKNWANIWDSKALTTPFTSVPDRVGLGVLNRQAGLNEIVSCSYWSQSF
jgi:hypothetical protein